MESIGSSMAKWIKIKLSTEMTVFVAYIFLAVILSILSPHFLTFRNLMNIGIYSSIIGTMATGMTLVILSGGLDLSVGSIVALTSVIIAGTMPKQGSIILSVLYGLMTGLICGFINGLIISKLRINPIITTLATMSIFRGIAYLTVNGIAIMAGNPDFKIFGRGFISFLPVSFLIMLIAFLILNFVLKSTLFGRKVYAVGGNSEASHLSGISISRVRLSIYTICGFTAGISGVILASQTGSGLPQSGQGMEMDVIASVILGGTSLSGGKGKMVGTFIGVLMLATLDNGLTLLNIPSFWQLIAKGIVLLCAVVLDTVRGGGYKY